MMFNHPIPNVFGFGTPTKFRQIIRPRLAIQKNICVWTYEKEPRVIQLNLESNTYILDGYDDY